LGWAVAVYPAGRSLDDRWLMPGSRRGWAGADRSNSMKPEQNESFVETSPQRNSVPWDLPECTAHISCRPGHIKPKEQPDADLTYLSIYLYLLDTRYKALYRRKDSELCCAALWLISRLPKDTTTPYAISPPKEGKPWTTNGKTKEE